MKSLRARASHSLGKSLPVLVVVELEVVLSTKLAVQLVNRHEFFEFGVESDLKVGPGPSRSTLTLSRVMGSRNGEIPVKKALIHQLLGQLQSPHDTCPTYDMFTTRPRPSPRVSNKSPYRPSHSRST